MLRTEKTNDPSMIARQARMTSINAALPSWHPKANVSSIVPRLSENVTSFQHSFVVTEQGAAACFGHTQSEQAVNLINNAAHPDAREELVQAASEFGLI